MSGARETVAKAVTLECMRGAVRQRRACFLYAFRSAHKQPHSVLSDSGSAGIYAEV